MYVYDNLGSPIAFITQNNTVNDGLFGPDELLRQDLIDNGIPFVIHLP
jgi:hypothetical protein